MPFAYKLWGRFISIESFGASIEKGSIIGCFHQHFFITLRWSEETELADHLFSVLISNHTDAYYIEALARFYGVLVAKGDSLHEAKSGFIAALRTIKKKRNLVVAVDGPVGPKEEVKPGILMLSKLSNEPIQFVFVFPKRAIHFKKSWDQFFIPMPFSKVRTYVTEKYSFNRKLSRIENLEIFRRWVQKEKQKAQKICNQ